MDFKDFVFNNTPVSRLNDLYQVYLSLKSMDQQIQDEIKTLASVGHTVVGVYYGPPTKEELNRVMDHESKKQNLITDDELIDFNQELKKNGLKGLAKSKKDLKP